MFMGTTSFQGDTFPLFCPTSSMSLMQSGWNLHLQEDYMFVPVLSNSPAPQVKELTVLRRARKTSKEEDLELEQDEWEIENRFGGYLPERVRMPLTGPVMRPDTIQSPRVAQLRKEPRHGTDQAKITTGPILLGIQDVVVSAPADLQPTMGVARQVLNVLPRLTEVLEREFAPMYEGDVVACQIAAAGVLTRCYIILTRKTERYMESRESFEVGMAQVMRHAEAQGVSTLATLRPPGAEKVHSWKSAADYFTEEKPAYFIRHVLHLGTEVSAEEWFKGSGEVQGNVRRIAFLGSYDHGTEAHPFGPGAQRAAEEMMLDQWSSIEE